MRPPEAGGLGMPPGEAKRLTIPEAIFYLSSENEIKRSCRQMNRLSHFGREVTPDEIVQSHRDHMAALRKQFTGSDDVHSDL